MPMPMYLHHAIVLACELYDLAPLYRPSVHDVIFSDGNLAPLYGRAAAEEIFSETIRHPYTEPPTMIIPYNI